MDKLFWLQMHKEQLMADEKMLTERIERLTQLIEKEEKK